MKLVQLGTSGFLPTDRAQTACYLLPEAGIWLDAGSGLYRLPEYLQTPLVEVYIHHNPLEELDYRAELAPARDIFPFIEIGEDRMEVEF